MRKAFTILEMLAATALAALLMLAVLHVIGSVGRTRAALAREFDPAWRAQVLETLRLDLTHSTGVRYEPNGVTLTGHAGLDRATLAPDHKPVTVAYGLATVAGRNWLYRRQTPRAGSGRQPWRELLCADVTTFSVRPAAAPADRPAAHGDQEEEPLPVAVSVEITGPAGAIARETVVLK